MTLQEAIKSGQRFRRAAWTHGDCLEIYGGENAYMRGELHWCSGERATLFFVDDLLAEDWVTVRRVEAL